MLPSATNQSTTGSKIGSTTESTTAVSTSATVSATITPIVNDLAAGTSVHNLTAGDVSLTVNYWSTLSMPEWTAAANKPLSFSLIGALGTDDGQAVYLSRVTLTPEVSGNGGALSAPAASTDQASISPGYLIKAPYSYSETFVLPALDPLATSITLSVTYELLIQSTPTSTQYAKQTASDTITIAIAATA